MQRVKEISVFSIGDATKLSTWSNVPYFFTKTLEEMGLTVNRIDISPNEYLDRLFFRFVQKPLNLKFKDASITYFRSSLNYFLTNLKVRKAVSSFKNAQINLFLTFSFSHLTNPKIPNVHFGDWTYAYYLKHFSEKRPGCLDKLPLYREQRIIEKAAIVFALFPKSVEFIRHHFNNKHIFYNGNVVNSLVRPCRESALKRRSAETNILFVGNDKYLNGARVLVEAFEQLQQQHGNLKLHIVGIGQNLLPVGHIKNISLYGYLNKDNNSEREKFYRLLTQSDLFVNTNEKWPSFSAALEAMYFYNAVITIPNPEFIATFGKDLDFGFYCEPNNTRMLRYTIEKYLNNKNSRPFGAKAHDAVKHFTWENFVERFLGLVNAELGKPANQHVELR